MRPGLVRGVGVWVILAALFVPSTASGQTSSGGADTPSSPVDFLTAFAFDFGAARLAAQEEQFSWEGHFRGGVDLVDWGPGRVEFLADYTVTLGDELRSFDPNQGRYRLAFRGSRRFGRMEVGGQLHHVSRHLSDRAKTEPIDWNMLGLDYHWFYTPARTRLDLTVGTMWVVQKSFVDYTWQLDYGATVERDFTSRAMWIGRVEARVVGTDQSIAGRQAQGGVYAEAGVRLGGRGAAIDLFLAGERRIDPLPLERGTASWAAVGFRLRGR